MIKVYFIEIEYDEATNIEKVKGIDYIHNAVLLCTEKPDVRKLIMDITPDEDAALSASAVEVREPTNEDILIFQKLPVSGLPARDLAAEIDDLSARLEKLEAA